MNRVIFSVMVVPLLLVGCQSSDSNELNDQSTDSVKINKELSSMEYTIGSNDWPVLVQQNATPEILEAYQFALDHPEVLNYMPCYCGCYEEDGHTSNTNCFVESVDKNVAILDEMGLGWGICVDIAREAKSEYEKGTDLKTIRKLIDQKYGANGVEPTPTPMPS